jgi:hypothetical protein
LAPRLENTVKNITLITSALSTIWLWSPEATFRLPFLVSVTPQAKRNKQVT